MSFVVIFGPPAIGKMAVAYELAGLIFTYVWAVDQLRDKGEIDSYCELFRRHRAKVYFVELEADLKTCLERNKTEFRLSKKASKRDIQRSEMGLLNIDQRYTLNSDDDFFYMENYLKTNTMHLTPQKTAHQTVETLHLPLKQPP